MQFADSSSVVEATVIENSSALLVEPKAGSPERQSGDRIVVHMDEKTVVLDKAKKKTDVADISPGAQVSIRYDGTIAESYPAQILHCYEIRILE